MTPCSLPFPLCQLQVPGTECELLVRACLPYLSSHTSSELVEVCKRSLIELASLDSDLVWLMLIQLVPNALPQSPHPSLKTLVVSLACISSVVMPISASHSAATTLYCITGL